MSKCAMNFAPPANLAGIARNAIVETRAEREQTIAIVHRIVRKGGAVHAQHAHGTGD